MMIPHNDQSTTQVPNLDLTRLDQMARVATAQPQQHRTAMRSIWNFFVLNAAPARLSFATAALVVLLSITVILADLPQSNTTASADSYAELSDLLMLDVMDDMASS